MSTRSRAMKSYPGWLQIAILILILVLMIGALKNLFLKHLLVRMGPPVIGTRVEIDRFSLSILRQRISVKGLKLYSPAGFPDEIMLDVPDVSIKFVPWKMLGGRLYISDMVVRMKELVIIKDRDKNLNVDALKIVPSGKDSRPKDEEVPGKKSAKTRFTIAVLQLNLERVVVKDFSKGDDPVVTVHDIPLKDKTIRDIDSLEKLVTVLIVQAMGPTALKGAGIYTAAAVLGVGFLPAGVIGVIVADDDSAIKLQMNYEEAFDLCLDFIAERGRLKKQHREKGYLNAKLDGYDVRFSIVAKEPKMVRIRVTARKFMLPKPAYAGGIIYQLERRTRNSQ